ncbi:CHRD domain-containing protein [Roseibium sp. RKSG952]|uniref:CHRD domain-containing protein n=1 Tax=Roseibium sp. RKSG952 TaxID=2529384 RepID=UPI0012BC96FE|nr:CHRD domain-containing protein [Roseibium sp. RKSG952]MTH96071.1 CHRD domain-containing protein [Roseibium sp. RKSG952]
MLKSGFGPKALLSFACLMAPLSALAQDATSSSPATNEVIGLRANLSPADVRGPLNYEPTKGPLESFFPDCSVDKQMASELSEAFGEALISFDPENKEVRFGVAYKGLSGNAIMAHFHDGAPGVNGPVLQTICGHPPPTSAIGVSATAVMGDKCPVGNHGVLSGTWQLTDHDCPEGSDKSCISRTVDEQVQLLACGNLYVNIHTCLNQPGEVAGQITPVNWIGKEQNCNALPPKSSQ